ncbi:MAG: hypothetical protein WDO19_13190 [Bacteroidota bacterium]
MNAAIEGNNSVLVVRNNAIARLKHVDMRNVDRLIYHYYTPIRGGTVKSPY